jgi:hypothetical protein
VVHDGPSEHEVWPQAEACLILVIAGVILLAVSPTATRAQSKDADLQRLQQAVDDLQRTVAFQNAKMVALEQESVPATSSDATEPGTTAAEAGTAFIVNRNGRSPAQRLAPRLDNVPIEPVAPGFIRFPGTQVLFQFGGDVSTVLANTSKYFSPTWMITSTIPVRGQPYFDSHTQFAFTANQSDVNFEFRMPSPLGALRVVYNNDFSQPTPAFAYHLNHFYAQAGNLFVGFSDSVFCDIDSYPTTLDYEGVNSLVFYRHAVVAYSVPLHRHQSHQLFLKMSLEYPESQVSAGSSVPREIAPDLGAQLRFESKAGHVQLAGILRALGTQNPATGAAQTVIGWGLNLTGGINFRAGDFLSAGVSGGQGVAAYSNDAGGSGLDAALNAAGSLVALPIFGAFVGYTHNWVAQWSSTGAFGVLSMNDSSYQAALGAGGFRRSAYASLNLAYRPWTNFLFGLEGLYGIHKLVNGASGEAWREQGTIQYTF